MFCLLNNVALEEKVLLSFVNPLFHSKLMKRWLFVLKKSFFSSNSPNLVLPCQSEEVHFKLYSRNLKKHLTYFTKQFVFSLFSNEQLGNCWTNYLDIYFVSDFQLVLRIPFFLAKFASTKCRGLFLPLPFNYLKGLLKCQSSSPKKASV
jgi:hypothetical protein